MRERQRSVNVRPYLPHALLATLGVLGLPFLAVVALLRVLEPDPNFLVVALVGFAIAVLAAGLGIALWKTRPESADIAFGELLIWGWLQRKRADDRLDAGAALLGLDRSGHPTQPVKISPERQLDVLQNLNQALEAKDAYTHGHSQRVERHSYRTAAAMGLSVDAIEELRLAAALHDVGKIRIPDRVLRKPGRLTREEREIVEEHVVVGAWMVSSVGSADVVSSVRHHHERWDGRGYPDGLAGTDIPLFARVIAVADAYDAITSTRPYRVSSGREHAVGILRAEAGTQFDPMIVNSFIDALPVRIPVAGALVLLAGPAALGRKLAMWLKRVGAGHLAPAAATLGAVVTLGSFMPAPSFVVPPPRIVAQEGSTETVGSTPVHPEPIKKKVTRLEPQSEPQRVVVADAGTPAREVNVVMGDTVVRPMPAPVGGRDPKPTPEPTPATDPDPGPEPEPTPATGPDPGPEPEPTPAADDGCTGNPDSNGHANGKGHAKAKGKGRAKAKGKGRAKAKGKGRAKHCD